MQLRSWLSLVRGRVTRLAARMGVAPGRLSQMADCKRPIPEEVWTIIEAETAGEVRRWDLWPTRWHRIWPDLIGTPGAPPVPAANDEPEPATLEVADAA